MPAARGPRVASSRDNSEEVARITRCFGGYQPLPDR